MTGGYSVNASESVSAPSLGYRSFKDGISWMESSKLGSSVESSPVIPSRRGPRVDLVLMILWHDVSLSKWMIPAGAMRGDIVKGCLIWYRSGGYA